MRRMRLTLTACENITRTTCLCETPISGEARQRGRLRCGRIPRKRRKSERTSDGRQREQGHFGGQSGADPEVRTLPSGNKVVNLSVATSDSWRDKNSGERKEKTEWHRVVIFSEGLAQGRRAISAQGQQGLPRGRAADPQVAGPVRRGQVFDRGGAAGLQLEPHHARRARRRRGRQPDGLLGPAGGASGTLGGRRPSASAPAFESGGMDDDIPF